MHIESVLVTQIESSREVLSRARNILIDTRPIAICWTKDWSVKIVIFV